MAKKKPKRRKKTEPKPETLPLARLLERLCKRVEQTSTRSSSTTWATQRALSPFASEPKGLLGPGAFARRSFRSTVTPGTHGDS